MVFTCRYFDFNSSNSVVIGQVSTSDIESKPWRMFYGSFHVNSTKVEKWPLQNWPKFGVYVRDGMTTSQEKNFVWTLYTFSARADQKIKNYAIFGTLPSLCYTVTF